MGMPKLKRKTVAQRSVAMRALMRARRSVGDGMGDGEDGPGCSVADPAGSVPDEGRDGPTDLTRRSVPDMAASAVRPSGEGACKQMEVKARLFKPSGPSVLDDWSVPGMAALTVRPSGEGACKQMEVKARLFKPSGPSVLDDLPCDLPYDLLDDLPCDLLDDLLGDLMNELTNELLNELLNEWLNDSTAPDETLLNDFAEPERDCMKSDGIQCLNSDINQVCTQPSDEYMYTATPVVVSSTIPCQYTEHRLFKSQALVFGSFHQNDHMFSEVSRGSQCTINALCSLIYAQFSDLTSTQHVDNVLVDGDCIYNTVIFELKAQNTFKSRLLNFDEIPRSVTILSKEISVVKSDVISGVCVEQFGNLSLPSLHQSLLTALRVSDYILVMVGSICSAVFREGDDYYFFDSHSHGPDGLSSPDGKSILVSFSCVEDLVTYMYGLYESMMIELTSQFELLPLHLLVSNGEYSQSVEAPNNTVPEVACDTEWTTVKSRKKGKHFGKDTSFASTDTLMDKYFHDQKEKNDLFSKCDRKEYFRMYRQKKRQSVEFKEKEVQYQRESKQKSRMSSDVKQKDREVKQKARLSGDFRAKEVQYQRKSKQKSRMSSDVKQKDREVKQKARLSGDFRAKEVQYQRKSKQKSRMSSDVKQKDREVKQKARLSGDFRAKEVQYQRKSKQNSRMSSDVKQKDREVKQKSRMSQDFKRKEAHFQRRLKQKAREDPLCLEMERIAKQQWRSNSRNKVKEKKSDCERKALKRKDPVSCEIEQLSAKRRKFGTDLFSSIENFHRNVSVGPTYICSSCHQTWFRQSVSEVRSLSQEKQLQFLTKMLSVDGKEWICTTCKSNIQENRMPKLSVLNGMKWPEKPNELRLFPLEERLISLRIPFMQLRELPKGRQYSVKGNVVNVPTDVQPVVDSLPRPVDDNVVVAVKLKKKMSYTSCAFTENVRPVHVLVALHWLMRHSELYKNANINIDEEWARQVTEDSQEILREFVASDKDSVTVDTEKSDEAVSSENVLYDSDAEENAQENVGNLDTLVDYSNLDNRIETFTFAPGEGQKPLSIYQDVDSEYLCFPTIFCGQRRLENVERQVPVNYSDIAKWELRSNDRRAANSVPNIFYKLKKIQMKQLNDKVNLAVRQCQLDGKNLTAGQIRDANYTEEFVRKDHGYYIFKQLRNSPAYLETKKKDVFAMLRQLGLPTWFMSLSSADTRWTDLLKMLGKLNMHKNYTDEEVASMSWEEKIKLVQKDPVTCSRYFDHRVQEFIKVVLKSDFSPIGLLTDYFYRVEFQQRGSPHIHMIVWIENSPKMNENSLEEIMEFVDKYLTCSSDQPDFQNLVDLQTHKHSRTCRKKEDKVCRFGYPLPPLPKTMVLEPLESHVDKYKKLYQKLQKKMNDEKEGFDMTYDQFLVNVVELQEDEYIKCIRSSLKAAKVFLKRSPKDIRVNYYNETVLQAWKANMDMQFVLDPYACAMYIVSYISKSQRGMSALMHAACKEAKQGNLDIKRQVRHVGNIFSNSVEVSAQEAVYLVLQMPLTRCTRDVVFINTSPANKRVHLLKTSDALEELPADSTDVLADNVIKRYAKRPKCLEHYCLADYVSQLEIVYPKDEFVNTHDEVNDDDLCEDEQVNFGAETTILKLKNGIVIRKRKTQKVIRYVRFNRKTNEENHYREKLLLFYPWRSEEKDLLGNFESFKTHYQRVKNIVDSKVKQYEHNAEELEQARDSAEQDENSFDDIVPGAQEEEASVEQEEPNESETFVYFNPNQAAHKEYDIGIELGIGSSAATVEPTDNILSEDDYYALLRSLNSKQRQFYNHVVHWLKVKDEPIYAFLSGGAGVGKSVVIKALYQTLYRMLNLREGENPDDIRILLCAFTGKAAYNINGATISSAFMERFKQANQTLGCDQLNTFRSKYRNLSVIIIDEISMVSNRKLSFIDQRLQALTGTRIPFGGKSIIAVGDLYQLKPVADSWIFEDLSKDASSLAPNLWQEHFTMFELTQIMRQKDDLEFAQLLNRLRHNEMTEEDKKQITNCSVNPDAEGYPNTAPHIFAENYFMDQFNQKMIMNFDAEKVTIECHDSIVGGNVSAEKQKHILSRITADSSRTMGLQQSLTVVVGMIYDLTINLDTEDGLNNGSPGVVQAIEYKQAETNRPSIIWVKFDDLKVGSKRRRKYESKGFYHDGIDQSWTPVFDVERTFPYNKLNIQRIQFPLQPSAGRSVYRAQGTTLDTLVIDLTQKRTRKIPHLHYVALSRVRSMQNLHIVNFNEKALQLDEKVVQEMKRLDETAKMQLCYAPLDTVDSSDYFKVAFNNCRSLHKHIEDVKADQNVLSAHIIAFAESRLCERDVDEDYFIDGFNLIRNDQCSQSSVVRPSHGLALYVKTGIEIMKSISYSEQKLEFTFVLVKIGCRVIQVVTVYKAPSLPYSHLKQALERDLCKVVDKSKDIIILGDFNTDVSQPNNSLCAWMKKKLACEQLINSITTDYGTTLDLIFTNCEGLSGVVETYWSDHKLVYFGDHL